MTDHAAFAKEFGANSKFSVSKFVDEIGLTKFSWFIFVVLGICNIFEGYDYMIVSYTVPSLQAQWGLTSAITGSLSSWSLIGLVLGGCVAGPLADKLGRKKAIVSMTIIYGVLNLPIYFSHSWVWFAASALASAWAQPFRWLLPRSLSGCLPRGAHSSLPSAWRS